MVMVGVSISPNPPNSYETTCAYTDPTTGAFYNLTGMILNQGGPYYSYELQNTDVFQVNICNVVPPTYCSGLGIPTSVCQLSGTSQYSCGNVTTQTFSSLPSSFIIYMLLMNNKNKNINNQQLNDYSQMDKRE